MSTYLQKLDMSSPVGNLESYIHWVNQVPMLSQEKETELATRFREHNDLQAARELVMAHLRFVVKVARGYSGYGLQQADLIQEGNIGLMKAVKRFDPGFGVRLVSFAVHWIKAEIHEFIIKNWRIVKVATTKAQRKLFFNLRQSKKRLGWFSKAEVDEVAETLGVKPEVVMQMETRMNASHDVAFEMDVENDDNGSTPNFAPAHYLEDKRYDPAQLVESSDYQAQGEQRLTEAFAKLDTRSMDILQKRWLNDKKTTLQELADTYNVSAERIRQLEQNAMKKLREQMTSE